MHILPFKRFKALQMFILVLLLPLLRCVAVCCRVLPCVAVCCSVLQCVADVHSSLAAASFAERALQLKALYTSSHRRHSMNLIHRNADSWRETESNRLKERKFGREGVCVRDTRHSMRLHEEGRSSVAAASGASCCSLGCVYVFSCEILIFLK